MTFNSKRCADTSTSARLDSRAWWAPPVRPSSINGRRGNAAHLPSSGLEFKLSQPGSPLDEKHKGGVPASRSASKSWDVGRGHKPIVVVSQASILRDGVHFDTGHPFGVPVKAILVDVGPLGQVPDLIAVIVEAAVPADQCPPAGGRHPGAARRSPPGPHPDRHARPDRRARHDGNVGCRRSTTRPGAPTGRQPPHRRPSPAVPRATHVP